MAFDTFMAYVGEIVRKHETSTRVGGILGGGFVLAAVPGRPQVFG